MTKRLCSAIFTLLAMIIVGISPAMAREGVFTWSGRVDERLDIVVSGRNVSYKEMTGGRTSGIQYRFSDPLPSQRFNARLEKLDGRGSARIIEYPNRDNGYAAIIRIEDPREGSDKYSIELHWDWDNGGGNDDRNGNNDRWRNGGWRNDEWRNRDRNNDDRDDDGRPNSDWNFRTNRIRWTGRIDSKMDIQIRVNTVTWRVVEGNGAKDVRYRIGHALPLRPVACSVNKREGRGNVFIIKQPNRNNDYILVIRVVDSEPGSDFYDFTVRW